MRKKDELEEKEDEEKSDRAFKIVVLIIIIILLILLYFRKFGRINELSFGNSDSTCKLIPTGNVDVFDIDIDCNCNTINGNKKCTSTSNGNVIPTFVEERDSNVLGKVFVDDKNGDYIYQENLEIFTNAAYEYTNKIAPGVGNVYHFVVHNSTNKNLKYIINMYEESEYKVNLKYRLKKADEYIIGDDDTWVSASRLKTEFNHIMFDSSDAYSLEWKWFYNDNFDYYDTLAGKEMTDSYKLHVRFYFEEDV